jgi:hypothetical protein
MQVCREQESCANVQGARIRTYNNGIEDVHDPN